MDRLAELPDHDSASIPQNHSHRSKQWPQGFGNSPAKLNWPMRVPPTLRFLGRTTRCPPCGHFLRRRRTRGRWARLVRMAVAADGVGLPLCAPPMRCGGRGPPYELGFRIYTLKAVCLSRTCRCSLTLLDDLFPRTGSLRPSVGPPENWARKFCRPMVRMCFRATHFVLEVLRGWPSLGWAHGTSSCWGDGAAIWCSGTCGRPPCVARIPCL